MNSTRKAWLGLTAAALFFQPVATAETLQEALASAYVQNPQLKAERERVRESDENYVQAAAQGKFSASAQASAGMTTSKISTFSSPSPFNGFVAGTDSTKDTFVPRSFAITGQKPLYQGGRVRSLKGQAKYGILAARENLRNAEQNVLLTAATAYADVLQNEEVAAIRRNNVLVLARQGDAATDRFDVGAGTRTDVAQAESRMAAAEIGLASAEANLAESRAAYYRATGHMPEQLQRIPDFALPATLGEATRLAMMYNPQLEAARYSLDAARFGIDVAKSTSKPTVSIQTFTQIQTDQGGAILGQEALGLSANLTVPIFTGGLNASRVRAAKAAENRTIFEVRNIEEAIVERTASLWAQLEGARRALVASQRQIDAAQIAYEGVEIEQQVGTRNALDVLNAEQEVLNAKLAYAQSQRNADILTFQLLNLLGAFDALSLNLPVNYYDPAENFETVTNIGLLDPLKAAAEDLEEPLQEIGQEIIKLPKRLKDLLPGQ